MLIELGGYHEARHPYCDVEYSLACHWGLFNLTVRSQSDVTAAVNRRAFSSMLVGGDICPTLLFLACEQPAEQPRCNEMRLERFRFTHGPGRAQLRQPVRIKNRSFVF